MFWFFQTDEMDPIARSYRLYFRKLCVYGLVLLVLATLVGVVGVPHLQLGEYHYSGHIGLDEFPPAGRKYDAWYLSVTGWKHVHSGQYGHHGCPYILFIPIGDCIDLHSLAATFPFTLFAKEQSDERS